MSDVMYHVIHNRRIMTIAGACLVLIHNLRLKFSFGSQEHAVEEVGNIPVYIDPESMKYNKMYGCLSTEEFCLEYQRLIEQAKLERKIQKNASRVIEMVISASHSFCADWKTNDASREKVLRYLEDAVKWERERHGNVQLSVTYHMDELTPHCHILSVPLVPYFDKTTNEPKMKFSASEFFGSKGDLIKMHTDFHENVGKKYGLERGQYGSRASHKELKDYKSWEREQRDMLMKRELALDKTETATNEQQQHNAAVIKALSERENELLKREYKVGFDSKVLELRKKEFAKMAERTNQDIPRIPVPPITLNKVKINKWVNSVQEHVTKTFQAIKAAYESMGVMYNKAITEVQKLRTVNKQLQDENVKMKFIILNIPLAEIQAQREAYAAKTKEQKRQSVEPDEKDQGRSR